VRRPTPPAARIVLLAVCALVATACGAKPEPTSGKLDTTYPASARDGSSPNRIITVEAPPRLVLVVTGGPQRLLARLGVRAAVAPADVTVARVEAAHPDLVVVGPGLTADEVKRNDTFIQKLGVPVFVMPGARLEDIERASVALGVLTNHAEAGRALALKLRRQRQDIAHRLEGVAPLNVYVDAGFGTSIQRTTLLARLLQLAGAHLVGPSDGVATVNAKTLHRLDPDAYIATSTSGVTLARLRSQPRLRSLRAVTAGRFFTVDPATARADTTAYALMRSLAHLLHPTIVKQ
jgi:ABC-type Fe3+-hydroxamate transport system substrate-binding protein